MKKRILSIIALLIGGGVCAQTNPGFVLTGKIKNLKEGTSVTLLSYKLSKGEKNDTLGSTIVHDGKFQLKGSVSGPTYSNLLINGNLPYQLFIENTKMEIVGDSLKSANVAGSTSETEYVAFKKTIAPINEEMLAMSKSWPKKPTKDEREQLLKRTEEIVAKQKELARLFATQHPNSFVSPVVLITTAQYYLDPVDAYLLVYNKLSDAVKSSDPGKLVKFRLDDATKVRVGDIVPAISSKTPDGKDLSLAEVLKEGKLTLIDFWASWCGPCRAYGAEVKKLYTQYNAKGFNVLGVSVDQSLEQWKKAIAEDKTDWHHVTDANSKIKNVYGVHAVPATFLVDAKGKVIAKSPKIEELAQILAKELNEKL
ncbi:TlpA disulfide reductase family protein [Solitalea lacus]|uniref:TlpA disulfide reductase family protein n=1 Tax=Solitalea lacus TaxID=2911172 RepID=UPI001EDAF0A9|nr:TlpA disulfide reductase family protein [Solitalea lacus]UKJ08574.1 AhpC/TSA family protein [Solitalea lacus]